MENLYYVYILTNQHCNVIYVGVTNNLIRRVYEHKNKLLKGFTLKYNVDRLIYYEAYEDIGLAIKREKQIKGWTRLKKNLLVSNYNASWKDLYVELF